MKKLSVYLMALLACGVLLVSCNNDTEVRPEREVSQEIITKVSQLGFSTDGLEAVEGGYLIEGDIFLTAERIDQMQPASHLPEAEQYSTDNLVTGLPRVITVYMSTSGFGSAMQAGLDEAIRRYNAENLQLTFQRTTSSSNADISFANLSWFEEWLGVLGSAGFPTASGDPYHEIKMNSQLQSKYGMTVNGIATVIAHEMGHCIGFRHTDYFDRSISCGGSTNDEGASDVGANHIPGTPTGATLAAASWMLACTDGSDRPFNSDDKTALDYLY